MSVFERTAIGPFLTRCIPVVALTLFLAPTVTSADQLLLLHNPPVERLLLPEAPRQTVRRPLDICLNENGDLAIRRGAVSLTMAYTPPDDVIEPQERARSIRLQKSGISLKVSFLF